MIAALDHAIEAGQSAAQDRRSGQMNIFDAMGGTPEESGPKFPSIEPWSESQILAAEKETLGFYVTSHPLVRYGRELTMLSAPSGVNLASLDKFPEGARVMIGCAVAAVRPTATKKDGRRMAMLTLEDLFGKSDAVVFPDTYEKTRALLEKDALVFVSGSIDRRREKPSIIVDDLIPINAALEQLTLAIKLTLPGIQPGGEFLGRLQERADPPRRRGNAGAGAHPRHARRRPLPAPPRPQVVRQAQPQAHGRAHRPAGRGKPHTQPQTAGRPQ